MAISGSGTIADPFVGMAVGDTFSIESSTNTHFRIGSFNNVSFAWSGAGSGGRVFFGYVSDGVFIPVASITTTGSYYSEKSFTYDSSNEYDNYYVQFGFNTTGTFTQCNYTPYSPIPTVDFSNISKLFVGSSEVVKAYIGTSQIYGKPYSITATVTNATAASGNPTTVRAGKTATLNFTFDGTSYECPSVAPVVTNATGTWTKNSATSGTMVLSNPTGAVSFTVAGQETTPQLETPTNLSVSGTTATFDEVENAESYEFFVDDVSIGAYTPTQSYTVAISLEQYGESEKTLLEILDGTEALGTLLYDWTSTSGTITQSVTCTSGYLTIRYKGAAVVTTFTGSGGVESSTSGATDDYYWHTFAVSGDGSISGFIEFDD